jgi:toxin-antitoxin system PIN domain toxin
VILVDANLLLYAEDTVSAHHEAARTWWDEQLSGSAAVCLCWPVINAFIRIATNARLHDRPLTLQQAIGRVESWFDQPCVRVIAPTDEHWGILKRLLKAGKALGNLVSDAQLAALAVEYNCELISTDADFARFKELKWRNPIE